MTTEIPDREHSPATVVNEPTVVDIPGVVGHVIPLPRTDSDPSFQADRDASGPVEAFTAGAAGPGTALVPDDAMEGELLTAAESRALDRRLAGAPWRRVVPATAARTVRVVRVVRDPETRTGRTTRAVVRHGLMVMQGAESWAVRGWDASTMGVYRRQIKAAERIGNQELLSEWIDRAEQAKERRHKRLMDLPALIAGIGRAALLGTVSVFVLVLVIGLLAELSDVGSFIGVLGGVLGAVGWTFAAVAIAWTPFVIAAPFLVVLALWREGRRRGTPPGWLATAGDADMDAAIDETTIARALGALRIPQITNYLKEGLPLQFITPARVDGRGTHAVLRLPAGVTAETIARRRAALATGLHRLAKEVWPTTGTEAGILDLWVADKGALAEGAGPYPLLSEGLVDVFKGVPVGKTLRGDPISAPLLERNTITGGMPGQGKSASARVIMAGAALDPTADLRIWVPDTNFDFEVFRERCSRYVMGAEDEKIEEILRDLRELHAEVQRRGELLVRYETPAVTRELANRTIGLHPVFCLLEEAHVAIQHKTHGREISQLLVDIVKLGRKRAIHMIVSTQAPTKDSMPRDVTRNCSNGIAFAVGDHHANDALLGQGAYAAGHRATELIPGTDRGTAVVKGFSGERSEIVQFYFLDVSKDNDQVTPIIQRALAAIAERGRGLPGARREAAPQIQTRDLLADLGEVLGADPVNSADVPALLRDLVPDWSPYQSLTGKALRERLDRDFGVKVPSTNRKYPIDPATIRDALAQRAAADPDPQE
ncbi:MAG: cell division protein FtsK [Labedaea sp.]